MYLDIKIYSDASILEQVIVVRESIYHVPKFKYLVELARRAIGCRRHKSLCIYTFSASVSALCPCPRGGMNGRTSADSDYVSCLRMGS
jgi:hypothetical protein